MKKSKILLSLVSVLLSCAVMFTVFSSSVFSERISRADVKTGDSAIGLRNITDYIYNRFLKDNGYVAPEDSNPVQNLEKVYLGGFPVGLKLYADGVVVVGTEAVDTENGYVNTAQKAGVKTGDIIKEINGEKVNTNKKLSQIIERSEGNEVVLTVFRDGEYYEFVFKSEFSVSEQKYKAGLWVRDSSAGIGTVTFCTSEGIFASLGHAVCDIDTGEVVPIERGQSTDVNLTGYYKGGPGEAGELCGVLESNVTGDVFKNGDLGVYGEFNSLPETQMYEIARRNQVVVGDALMYTTLENGLTESYTVKILMVETSRSDNKNLLIEVTDKRLIEKTGGIIQGMSGSPIIQNGKLVGAITHVLLDTPEKGYGILAETMLETAQSVVEEQLQNAS